MKSKLLSLSLTVIIGGFGATAEAQSGWGIQDLPQQLLFNKIEILPYADKPQLQFDYSYAPITSGATTLKREVYNSNPKVAEAMSNDSSLLEALLSTVTCKNNVTALIKTVSATGTPLPSPSVVGANILAPDFATATNPLCAMTNTQLPGLVPLESTGGLVTRSCGTKTCLTLRNPKIVSASFSAPHPGMFGPPATHQQRLHLNVIGVAIAKTTDGKQHIVQFHYSFPDKLTANIVDSADQPYLQHLEDVFTMLKAVSQANSNFAPVVDVTVEQTYNFTPNNITYVTKLNWLTILRSR